MRMLLYLREAPFLRTLKRASSSFILHFILQKNKGADYQLLYPQLGAQDKTRTCTNVIVHYPLKVACLPIPPPAREKVPRTGLEPACLSTHAPETCASTNSATWAKLSSIISKKQERKTRLELATLTLARLCSTN